MASSRDRARFPTLQTVGIPLAVSLYALVLHWSYRDILVPAFAYMGYKYESPSNLATPILIWFITVVSAWFLPTRMKQTSSLILWILFIVMLAPSFLLSPFLGILSDGRAISVSCGLSLAFIGVCLGVRRSKPVLVGMIKPPSALIFWVAIGVFSAGVYGYLAATAGISFRFLALEDVYDARSEYANELETAGLLGYLVSTQANVINPLVMARGILAKRKSIILIGAFGQLVLYSVTGFKTVLFSLAAIFILTLIFGSKGANPRGSILLWGASGLSLFAAIMGEWRDTIIWTSLFTRRFLVTPGRLSSLYFEFYTGRPPHLMAESSRGLWSQPEYAQGPARTISLWVTGTTETSMNANFFANGFAHFHWFGVIGAALVLLVYLRVLDKASAGIPLAASALVVVMPAITLSNTAIQTAMLSHGLALAVVCLALAPRTGWDKGKKMPDLLRVER